MTFFGCINKKATLTMCGFEKNVYSDYLLPLPLPLPLPFPLPLPLPLLLPLPLPLAQHLPLF